MGRWPWSACVRACDAISACQMTKISANPCAALRSSLAECACCYQHELVCTVVQSPLSVVMTLMPSTQDEAQSSTRANKCHQLDIVQSMVHYPVIIAGQDAPYAYPKRSPAIPHPG